MSIRAITLAATLLAATAVVTPGEVRAQLPSSPTTTTAQLPTPDQAAAGANCLLFGLAAAGGVYIYADVITLAATGTLNPALLIPSMAAGFVAGCGVGNILTPLITYTIGRPI